jgi:hypothetical protein
MGASFTQEETTERLLSSLVGDPKERKLSTDDVHDQSQLAFSVNPYSSLSARKLPPQFGLKPQVGSLAETDSRHYSSDSSSAEDRPLGGSLTREQRNEKVLKYWEKKKRRKSQRFIRYECRKNLAEKRFRY